MPTLSRKCISQYLGEENVIWALQGMELRVDNINLEGEDYKPTFPSPKVFEFFLLHYIKGFSISFNFISESRCQSTN